MKTLLIIICVSLLFGPPTRDFTYQYGGRNYDVHVPTGKGPYPVIINLHGGGSNSKQIAVQSGMNANADRNGYVVVYPNGTATGTAGFLRMYTWNAGLCCGQAMQGNVDDVAYIKGLLDDLPKHVQIDTKRIYVTGMSNGAMMAYRLGVELQTKFAAIGAVSTTMGIDLPTDAKPIPIIEIHGLLDNNAPYNGGVGSNAQAQPGGPPKHHSVANTIEQWSMVDGYDIKSPTVSKGGTYTEYLYKGANAYLDVYALTEGGHTWPGGVDLTAKMKTGKLISSFNANEVMWKFFSQYQLK